MYEYFMMKEKNMAPTDFFDLYKVIGLPPCSRFSKVLHRVWVLLLTKTTEFYANLPGFRCCDLGNPTRRIATLIQKIEYLKRVANVPSMKLNEAGCRLRTLIALSDAYFLKSEVNFTNIFVCFFLRKFLHF